MRKKTISKAKLIVTIQSKKGENRIETVSVFDNRENKEWTKERIAEQGIETFFDVADLKESLNWNLNGDSSKYQFQWEQSTKQISKGKAYIFD